MVAPRGGRNHHGVVAINDVRHRLVLPLCLLGALAALAGCAYDYPDPATRTPAEARTTPASRPSGPTEAAIPTPDPLVLEREVRNYQELDGLLKSMPGPVLLFQEGPLDGPARGFGTVERVPAAGRYTVTAACVGGPSARIFIRQENPKVTLWPVELTVDCPGATSQVITLQEGYVSAHLSLPGPADRPWTGGVGGVRVTG